MGEKLAVGLLTTAIVVPLCAVCILGPAIVGSIFAGIAGWLGGFDPLAVAGLSLLAGIAVYVLMRRRREQRGLLSPKPQVSDE